jgi:glyoxylase-like metal-dependent hydrolase (beta-lactamase superfamily II)
VLPRIDRVVTAATIATDDGPRAVETTTWLLGDEEQVLVVDAAHDATPIRAAVGDRRVVGVACTHAHRNHADQAVALADAVGAPTMLNEDDRPLWDEVHPDHGPDEDLAHEEEIAVAHVQVRVLHTPGHTPGSVCLYVPALDVVFTGDMLLKGGPLRVDRTLSRYPPITRSLRERVLGLPPQTRVLPGHGEETTIGDERDLPELVPPLEP